MSETNQLHALLSDMVAAYSSKKAQVIEPEIVHMQGKRHFRQAAGGGLRG